jgi:hypothetical protein
MRPDRGRGQRHPSIAGLAHQFAGDQLVDFTSNRHFDRRRRSGVVISVLRWRHRHESLCPQATFPASDTRQATYTVVASSPSGVNPIVDVGGL